MKIHVRKEVGGSISTAYRFLCEEEYLHLSKAYLAFCLMNIF